MRRRKVARRWIRGPVDELAIEQGCWFDRAAGEYVCVFIYNFCRQSKGYWAGQPLLLLPWQVDFVTRLFGWKRADGKRRYKRAYLEIAKKNGKSTLMSAIALDMLIAEGEPAPEIYICAVDRDQASIVYEESARMVESSPELAERLEVLRSKKRLVDPVGQGRLITSSADVQKQDGVNASGVIFDELHRQKNRQMWDIFEYAGVSREQPLTISITTAGESESGVWYEQRDYSERVNAGVILDTSHLGVVYRADPIEDDLDDPRIWRKANPSLGVTIREDDFKREFEEAKSVPEKLANFLRLRLNVITRGNKAFVGLDVWDRGSARPASVSGVECYGGADLSSVDDLTALALISIVDGFFDVEIRFWLPQENIANLERRHQAPYRAWADMGLIVLTPGSAIDYDFIRYEVNQLAGDRRIKRLLIDPYNATQLATDLKEKDGLPVAMIRQGYLSLNAPTKELQRLLISGKIRHGGHPILRWMASNAIAVRDPAGNLKLDKEKSGRKIDGLSAVVNALAGIVGQEVETVSIYEKKDLLIV